jgi:hypothetical protein
MSLQENGMQRWKLITCIARLTCRTSFFAFCTFRSGYAGVATFCRTNSALPVAAEEGLAGTVGPQNDQMAKEGLTRIHSEPSDRFWDRFVCHSDQPFTS